MSAAGQTWEVTIPLHLRRDDPELAARYSRIVQAHLARYAAQGWVAAEPVDLAAALAAGRVTKRHLTTRAGMGWERWPVLYETLTLRLTRGAATGRR